MAYTRLTVFGEHRAADLVLPDDEPLGALAPQILDLLDEPVEGGLGIGLITATGTPLDLALPLDEQGVEHGAMLRLVTRDETPQPPDVADVTVTLGEQGTQRRDRWGRRATETALCVLAGLSALVAGLALLASAPGRTRVVMVVIAALAVLAALGARRGRTVLAHALGVVAAGLVIPAALTAATGNGPLVHWVLPVAGLAAVIAVVIGLGMRSPAALWGGVLGVAAAGAVALAVANGLALVPVLAVAALTGLVILGVLPGIALSVSGLTRYDDLVIGGSAAKRRDVLAAVDESFAALTWSVAAIALPLGLSIHGLLRAGGLWPPILAVCAVLIVLLRSRMFPLVLQRSLLFAVAAVPVLVWFLRSSPLDGPDRAVAAGTIAVAAVLLAVARPSAVSVARLRRWAGTLELLAVLVLVPAVLGTLGIFADLLTVLR